MYMFISFKKQRNYRVKLNLSFIQERVIKNDSNYYEILDLMEAAEDNFDKFSCFVSDSLMMGIMLTRQVELLGTE